MGVSCGKLEFDIKNKTDVVLQADLFRRLNVEFSELTSTSYDIVTKYEGRFLDYLLRD